MSCQGIQWIERTTFDCMTSDTSTRPFWSTAEERCTRCNRYWAIPIPRSPCGMPIYRRRLCGKHPVVHQPKSRKPCSARRHLQLSPESSGCLSSRLGSEFGGWWGTNWLPRHACWSLGGNFGAGMTTPPIWHPCDGSGGAIVRNIHRPCPNSIQA
jgi:hypothetical protein